jgi:hypothetical protein
MSRMAMNVPRAAAEAMRPGLALQVGGVPGTIAELADHPTDPDLRVVHVDVDEIPPALTGIPGSEAWSIDDA